MAVAIIPARGGSKRLPGKNIRAFAGKPLLVHSIDVAKRVGAIDRILVTTDDPETARIAAAAGAEVVTRPPELATDHATTASAIRHALMTAYAGGAPPAATVTLQPNCPLRSARMVADAIELFQEKGADSVVTVTKNRHKLGTLVSGQFVPRYQTGMRSQDMQPDYYENGVLYVAASRMVIEKEDLFGSHIIPMVIDDLFALGDIDTELDFRVAEFLFHAYRARFLEERLEEEAPSGRQRGGNSWTSFG